MVALNPQITKSYAAGDYEYMHKLVFFGAKYSFFMMLLFVIPICLETELLLSLWLKTVPDYAVVFSQLSLLTSMCVLLGNTLTTSIAATGKIRNYELIVGMMSLSIFPLTWIAFKLGMSPVSCYIIYFLVFFLMIFVKIKIVSRKIRMSGWDYIKNVVIKVIAVTVLSVMAPVFICVVQEDSFIRLIEIGVVSFISTLFFVYYIGMSDYERNYCVDIIKKKLNRKRS